MVLTRTLEKACTARVWTNFVVFLFSVGFGMFLGVQKLRPVRPGQPFLNCFICWIFRTLFVNQCEREWM